MEINWERLGSENRIDFMADRVQVFIDAVLDSIDADEARKSPAKWRAVSLFFGGCVQAARNMRGAPEKGGERMAAELMEAFPAATSAVSMTSNEGFFEFMDWMSNPATFRPKRLRAIVEKA